MVKIPVITMVITRDSKKVITTVNRLVRNQAMMKVINRVNKMPICHIKVESRRESRRDIPKATIRDGITGGPMAGKPAGKTVVVIAGNTVVW